jgi:hypothetical protein
LTTTWRVGAFSWRRISSARSGALRLTLKPKAAINKRVRMFLPFMDGGVE